MFLKTSSTEIDIPNKKREVLQSKKVGTRSPVGEKKSSEARKLKLLMGRLQRTNHEETGMFTNRMKQ